MIAPDRAKPPEPAAAEREAGGLSCRRYAAGTCTVLALAGEIDEGSAAAFREELEAAVDRQRDKVVVDLSEVAFMDCSGVGELIQALGRAGWKPGSICLTAPTGPVRRVLDLTQVGTVCPIYDSLERALGVLDDG